MFLLQSEGAQPEALWDMWVVYRKHFLIFFSVQAMYKSLCPQ